MRWRGRRGSSNIEDRRGRGFTGRTAGIGGAGAILIIVVGAFLGVDLTPLLQGTVPQSSQSAPVTEADQAAAEFVSVALADTEDVWTTIFDQQLGRAYDPAVLVLYKGVTQSPCGGASGATGPFYCPLDEKVYLDTAFFTTLSQRLGASGDFAAAYVVAHEVAHHVQNELGILGQTQRIRAQVSEVESNAISVRTELQADCFSGIWARYARDQLGTLEPGDISEAMNAAKQIGDDTLQRNAGQVPQPHTFSHGTSAQRQAWFARGYETGDISTCDTFSANSL
ncbi:neutral zinc metallopeptidase [Leisingera aquaemixtae]|uniref:KPN_02809 family neutral zinc metallopeptidase n=1 Tax=Leisingera aquaemixtae TaxID=1396826 RepID=UPI0021A5ECC6|nr:neutral zinc metallopeptidase [Leisingera aquaemixtae]UWQ26498.1 neutral zinc metallopeptidase [Leisingera aquaemixtae]